MTKGGWMARALDAKAECAKLRAARDRALAVLGGKIETLKTLRLGVREALKL